MQVSYFFFCFKHNQALDLLTYRGLGRGNQLVRSECLWLFGWDWSRLCLFFQLLWLMSSWYPHFNTLHLLRSPDCDRMCLVRGACCPLTSRSSWYDTSLHNLLLRRLTLKQKGLPKHLCHLALAKPSFNILTVSWWICFLLRLLPGQKPCPLHPPCPPWSSLCFVSLRVNVSS